MKKRLLASLMALCLLVGLFPTAAVAVGDAQAPAEPNGDTPTCTCTELCTGEGNTDCPVCATDITGCKGTAPKEPGGENPAFTSSCTVTEGCTLEDGHAGDCVIVSDEGVESPESAPCILTEGCTLEDGHEGACVVNSPEVPSTEGDSTPSVDDGHQPETEVNTETTAVEKATQLITALPEVTEATLEDALEIEVAQAAYDTLTAEEKIQIDNTLVTKLDSLSAWMEELIAAQNILPIETTTTLTGRQTVASDTTWDLPTILSGNLTVEDHVTLTLGAKVTISGDVTISGGGEIKRGIGFTDELFLIPTDNSLTLTNITIDGGAEYPAAENAVVEQETVGFDSETDSDVTGVKATDSLIRVEGGSLLMADGAVLQNNYLASDSNNYSDPTGTYGAGVGITDGGRFEMDGGIITRMVAAGGSAVYCLGSTSSFEMNGGEITKNFSGYNGTSGGAAVRIYSSTFTMNGGKISYNASHNNTAVAVQGSNPLFTMNGGEICYNYGAGNNYGTIMATNGTEDGVLR